MKSPQRINYKLHNTSYDSHVLFILSNLTLRCTEAFQFIVINFHVVQMNVSMETELSDYDFPILMSLY